MWWHGPAFLHEGYYAVVRTESTLSFNNLPELKPGSSDQIESSLMVSGSSNGLNLDFLLKFSDINKKQRILAYVRRYLNNLKFHKTIPINTKVKIICPTVSELNKSMQLILKHEQSKYFSSEIRSLELNKPISNNSLLSLNPFIEVNGLMKVGGRLSCATIPSSQKYPIILPNKSHITELIVLNEHKINLHAGQKLLLCL